MTTDVIWILARTTGVASLVALTLSVLTGIALRTGAQIGLLDLIIPFDVSYGRVAIGLGTISAQLVAVVLISTWMRSSLSVGQWRAFHRLSYVTFAAAFAHGITSGTDLANPVIAALAWITAVAVVLVAVPRLMRLRVAQRSTARAA